MKGGNSLVFILGLIWLDVGFMWKVCGFLWRRGLGWLYFGKICSSFRMWLFFESLGLDFCKLLVEYFFVLDLFYWE